MPDLVQPALMVVLLFVGLFVAALALSSEMS